MKLYFTEHGEQCQPIYAHEQDMIDEGIEELEVFKAKREINSPFFYCKSYGEVGEKNGSCNSRDCKQYQPRNKKGGICTHTGSLYEQTNESLILKLKK